MSHSLTRRDALKSLGLLVGTATAAAALPGRSPQAAEALPHLSPSDPTAAALGYHDSAQTVDVKAFPTFKSNQRCDDCLQLQGKAGDTWRPCNLFPGKLVNAGGWCRVWTAKT